MRESFFKEGEVLGKFQNWAADRSLAVLSLHTTDLRGPVIECAVISWGGVTLFDERFKTSEPIADGAYAAHGIDNSDLDRCPALADVWPRLAAVLAAYRVVSYAPDFAAKALRRTLRAYLPAAQLDLLTVLAGPENSVIDAYSHIAGRPAVSGVARWAFVKLADAYAAQAGAAPAILPLDRSARHNALRVLAVIEGAAKMTAEQLPHLLPTVPDPSAAPQTAQDAQQPPVPA